MVFAGIKDTDLKAAILVVDDQALTRSMVKSILKGFGFAVVHVAESAATGLTILNTEPIDLIICDWNMPGMTGFEFLSLVREQSETMPFLMLTAEAYQENVQAAIDAGVTDYVIKPFTADVLLNKVQGAIKRMKLTPSP